MRQYSSVVTFPVIPSFEGLTKHKDNAKNKTTFDEAKIMQGWACYHRVPSTFFKMVIYLQIAK
jgi:hypothetical protein